MGALMILARQMVMGLRGVSVPAVVGAGAGAAGGLLGIPDFLNPFSGRGGARHRHRRRKMFTDTDIAQFAAAEAIAGKKAAQALMMIRAAKA